MKTLNVREGRTRRSLAPADISENGEQYLICRAGKPIDDLMPHIRGRERTPRLYHSRIRLKYDATEPPNPDEWTDEP